MEKILKGQLESISEKDYRKAVATLRRADKERVLSVWNEWKGNWVFNAPGDYLTKEEFYWENHTNGHQVARDRIEDRNLEGFDSSKNYVIQHYNGFVESVGKFFSKEFVDLTDIDFVASVVKYNLGGLAY